MRNIKILTAGTKDFGIIKEIQENDGFKHAYLLTYNRYFQLLKRGEIFYILYVSNEPVAFASLDIELRAKLHFFSVETTQQNIGYGKLLINHLLEKTFKSNVNTIYCYTEVGSPLEIFLRKLDFKIVGHYTDRYGEDKNANILERRIQP